MIAVISATCRLFSIGALQSPLLVSYVEKLARIIRRHSPNVNFINGTLK
jgi:hypothetical protein